MGTWYKLFCIYPLRALASKNAILYFFTISKSNFIIYTIPFYNSTHIKKLYSFTFSLKYYFLIFLYYIFSIVTFFQDSNCNIFLGFWTLFFFFRLAFSNAFELCFFFSRLALEFFQTCILQRFWTLFFFFSRLAFSNGHIFHGLCNTIFFLRWCWFQWPFLGLYHLFPTIFCFFKFNNYSKQSANKIWSTRRVERME